MKVKTKWLNKKEIEKNKDKIFTGEVGLPVWGCSIVAEPLTAKDIRNGMKRMWEMDKWK